MMAPPSHAALLLLTALVGGATGCAHRGLGFPGPTARMGHTPVAYADTLEDDGESEVDSQADQVAAARKSRSRSTRGGQAVADAASQLVGCRRLSVDGETYRWDCSGMVMAAHAGADRALTGNTESMYEQARDGGVLHKRKVPQPGDLAFFDNTYDRNHNGRRDDELTHIGVVEEVDAEGTITLVHLGSKGVVRIVMNLQSPHERTNARGEVINSYLRASNGRDGGGVLTGELWRSFGSLWKLDELGVADGLEEG